MENKLRASEISSASESLVDRVDCVKEGTQHFVLVAVVYVTEKLFINLSFVFSFILMNQIIVKLEMHLCF